MLEVAHWFGVQRIRQVRDDLRALNYGPNSVDATNCDRLHAKTEPFGTVQSMSEVAEGSPHRCVVLVVPGLTGQIESMSVEKAFAILSPESQTKSPAPSICKAEWKSCSDR